MKDVVQECVHCYQKHDGILGEEIEQSKSTLKIYRRFSAQSILVLHVNISECIQRLLTCVLVGVQSCMLPLSQIRSVRMLP